MSKLQALVQLYVSSTVITACYVLGRLGVRCNMRTLQLAHDEAFSILFPDKELQALLKEVQAMVK